MIENDFKITGEFYKKKKYKYRRYLNIIRLDNIVEKPDIMIIMMNPGSSKPKKNKDYNKEVEAYHDKTQEQIMMIMNNCNFNYARVLNLSDIREAKSQCFYCKLNDGLKENKTHSIFFEKRNDDFVKFFKKGIPVIFAWGVNKALKELAKNAIEKMNIKNPIGFKKEGVKHAAYYHPLRRTKKEQIEWVNKITKQLKK